jgi:4-hydroxybenzoate polyprenyltransferase
MWLNAALDRDEGEVLYGSCARGAPPAGTRAMGVGALVACVAVAAMVDWTVAACAGACAILAVAYSHPRWALKGHPWGGPAINLIGYGWLSPAAGFVVVGEPPTLRSGVLLVAFSAFILSFYFLAQSFQQEEDAARGYRTLVVTCGPLAVVHAMRICWWLGACLVAGLALAGWLPRICALAILVAPGAMRARAPAVLTAADAHRVCRWAFAHGLVLLALAWGTHLYDAGAGGPSAAAQHALQR